MREQVSRAQLAAANPTRRRAADELNGALILSDNGFRGSAGRASDARAVDARALDLRGVLALQRSAGNQAIGRLLAGGRGEAKVVTVVQRDDVQRDDVQRDDSPAPDSAAPTVTGPNPGALRLLPAQLWLTEPEGFLRNKPSLIPPGGLTLLPPAGVQSLIDWSDIGTAYRDRRLVLEDRDRAVIVGHWQRWYPVAQGLYKLPLAKSLFASPAAIMNTMSAKMIDSSLAGDRPNMEEMFNKRAEQFGVKTTTVSVTVGHF